MNFGESVGYLSYPCIEYFSVSVESSIYFLVFTYICNSFFAGIASSLDSTDEYSFGTGSESVKFITLVIQEFVEIFIVFKAIPCVTKFGL